MRTRTALAVISAAFSLTLLGIWWPEWRHYHVVTPTVSDVAISELRDLPNDTTLARLARISFEPPHAAPAVGSIRAAADDLLRGRWVDPGFGLRELRLPFDAKELSEGWPTQQLRLSSLTHVELLLTASLESGDVRYLALARDIVAAWANYERHAALPKGFLWNDHAIAKRLLVLTEFWRQYRRSTLFDEATAARVLQFVARSGRMLAKPSHFTARTNHGVMQNLALLHIATAFPTLDDSSRFRKIALERLRLQLEYYQSEEGVILEHSPGYHVLGTQLLWALSEYQSVGGSDLGLHVAARNDKACSFLALLERPDGTVPLIGNTDAGQIASRCDKDAGPGSRQGLAVFPISGYAIFWTSGGAGTDSQEASYGSSQSVIAWGNFATRAHKHDDEMALTTWIAGKSMLVGSGYFPYGHDLQGAANGWRGANSPHLSPDEPKDRRQTWLVSSGASNGAAFIDLERTSSASDSHIRRQIVMLGPRDWLIVDAAEAAPGATLRSVWTLFPGWTLQSTSLPGILDVYEQTSGVTGHVAVLSTGRVDARVLNASRMPFGGWVALGMSPQEVLPSYSVEVVGSIGDEVVTLWSMDRMESRRSRLGRVEGAERWLVCIDGDPCTTRVERDGNGIRTTGRFGDRLIPVVPARDVREQVARINSRFSETLNRFPPWRDYAPWRREMSQRLAGLWVAQCLLLGAAAFVARRVTVPRLDQLIVASAALCALVWIIGGLWIVFAYFGASWT